MAFRHRKMAEVRGSERQAHLRDTEFARNLALRSAREGFPRDRVAFERAREALVPDNKGDGKTRKGSRMGDMG
jgi:hypothetical protein